jgi:hypothetical protein
MKKRPILERFEEKIAYEPNTGCWLWTSATFRHGYGQFTVDNVTRIAHRFSYELYVGPIPAGKVIDHLCKTPACVNPAHLEPVTQRENVRRGESFIFHQTPPTYCARGHSYDDENTCVRSNGERRCKRCLRADREKWRVAHPELMRFYNRNYEARRKAHLGERGGSDAR